MKYAPILIPTLCRSEHFIRLIESLKKSTWTKYTDVYITLDYPLKEEHWNGYKKIKKYLNGMFPEFVNFYVIDRTENFGSSENSRELIDRALQKYDRYIHTNDDCEFSPIFPEYMDKALDQYEDDDSVVGVTGYSNSLKWSIAEECNTFKNQVIFSMWGTGFWRDKFICTQNEICSGYFRKSYFSGKMRKSKMTDARFMDDVSGTFNYDTKTHTTCMSDVAYGCYIQLADKCIKTHRLSSVKNWGFVGMGVLGQDSSNLDTGIDNAADYNYSVQNIDEFVSFDLAVEENADVDENKKILDRFDRRSETAILIVEFKNVINRIMSKLSEEYILKGDSFIYSAWLTGVFRMRAAL